MPPSTTSSPWWDWFAEKQDEQRLERLSYCKQLEEALALCEADKDTKNIESFSAGLRMMKYFDWRGILKEKSEQESAPIVKSCARERHSVWACRAVSIGCGKELAAIKKCFENEGAEVVLTQSQTTYEPNDKNNGSTVISCASEQVDLGVCVNQGARDLLARKQERLEAQKPAQQQQEQQEQQKDTAK
eukprot:Nitzschia sp. Nitz4//scaffold5_size260463//17653//18216//NITZ4_000939-RA/size260463-processed-gene-0.47-mRNA-1//1//CDS//3329555211//1759//frame0